MTHASAVLAAVVGCLVLAASAAAPNVRFGDAKNVGDTPLYREYGNEMTHGKIPYRDFFDEYPPGALPAFVVPALVPGDRFTLWSKALQALLAGCCVAAAAAAAVRIRGCSPWHVLLIGVVPLLYGRITFTRFDWWPAALTTAALALLLAGRTRLALGVLAVAVAAKEYPVVLLPLFLLYVDRARGRAETRRSAIAFAAVLAVVVVPFLALGPGGVRYSLEIQFRRPLQIESLGSAFLLAAHRLGLYTAHVTSSYGSQNLAGGAPRALSAALLAVGVLAVLAVWVSFARSRRDARELAAASVACVAAFVAFGKVLSPQYLIWLVALVPLLTGRTWRLAAPLTAVALALTQAWSQSRYHDVVALRPIVWAVVARDLVLVALFAVAYVGATQTSKPLVRTSR